MTDDKYLGYIHKHSHYRPTKDTDVYCLAPWTFNCTYLAGADTKPVYYLCEQSDHATWEGAVEAAILHQQGHTTEPITEDALVEVLEPCPWPDDE